MSTNALGTFLTKLTDWKYCPPSTNLWTVTFEQYNPGGQNETSKTHTFSNLYNDIEKANYNFTNGHKINQLYDANINFHTNNNANFVANAQDNNIGFFLATDISFNPYEVQVADQMSSSEINYSGFINYGKVMTGKNHNFEAKISFYSSNWDINEILFDRWIAAIGRQGLIESSDLPNIKARITISEYAAGMPGYDSSVWHLRKQIILHKAFPKNRESYKYSYDSNDAGVFKASVVNFDFSSYSIRYPENIAVSGLTVLNPSALPANGPTTAMGATSNMV